MPVPLPLQPIPVASWPSLALAAQVLHSTVTRLCSTMARLPATRVALSTGSASANLSAGLGDGLSTSVLLFCTFTGSGSLSAGLAGTGSASAALYGNSSVQCHITPAGYRYPPKPVVLIRVALGCLPNGPPSFTSPLARPANWRWHRGCASLASWSIHARHSRRPAPALQSSGC